jgi:tetratricopeptide (TPR) repeat protein
MLFQPSLRSILKVLVLLALSDAISADPEVQSVGKLRSGAELAFSNGDTEQSIKLWEEVINLEPNNDSNYYKRFRVFLRQQKLKEALSDLNAALKLNPQNENALVQRSKLQTRMGRCDEAVHDYNLLRK